MNIMVTPGKADGRLAIGTKAPADWIWKKEGQKAIGFRKRRRERKSLRGALRGFPHDLMLIRVVNQACELEHLHSQEYLTQS